MSRRPRILLADDDELLLKALTLRLEKLNVEVFTASDGYTSLARATELKPDLLILDVNMPAGDGFSVQERLSNHPVLRDIPVIYLTGDQSERLNTLCEQMGGFALFHKPFRLPQLIESINQALRPRAA
ncbi:MAG: response regulator [Phycisphaeraceae bacterium]|nr:response regulator [Phycisphaeraceae bacterium]